MGPILRHFLHMYINIILPSALQYSQIFLSLKFSYKLYIFFSLLKLTVCVKLLHLMTIMLLGAA